MTFDKAYQLCVDALSATHGFLGDEELVRYLDLDLWSELHEVWYSDDMWRVTARDFGFACFKDGYLYKMAVCPTFVRRGVGTWLVNIFEQYMREEGHPYLTLHCHTNNTGAFALYQKLGFRPVKLIDGPGPTEQALMMKEIRDGRASFDCAGLGD